MERPRPLVPLWVIVAFLVCSVALLLGAYHVGFTLPTEPLEAWAMIVTLAAVWFETQDHVVNWPVGLVGVALYGVLFYQQKFYANTGLQGVYVLSGIVGWYWWSNKSSAPALPTIRCNSSVHIALWAVCLALSYPAFLGLKAIGGAQTYWDGLTTLLSLAGQYLLMRRAIENWYFWLIADSIYIVMFFAQKLYVSSILSILFLVLSAIGLRDWKAKIQTAT